VAFDWHRCQWCDEVVWVALIRRPTMVEREDGCDSDNLIVILRYNLIKPSTTIEGQDYKGRCSAFPVMRSDHSFTCSSSLDL
jgi:hypothetical protein